MWTSERWLRIGPWWIENYTGIEVGGKEMRAQYEKFFRDVVARVSTPTSMDPDAPRPSAAGTGAGADPRAVAGAVAGAGAGVGAGA